MLPAAVLVILTVQDFFTFHAMVPEAREQWKLLVQLDIESTDPLIKLKKVCLVQVSTSSALVQH